uniref:Uncharacterized protein n=1 Tax=Anguilla anguilla TaxID=7936 RepID=A0A0E9SM39_ANGAN
MRVCLCYKLCANIVPNVLN